MKRIICVGNRYAPSDAAGPRVYDRLAVMALPCDVEVVDGGVAGLNLLHLAEGVERVVFVDAVEGFGRPGEVVVVSATDAAAGSGARYDHSAGLGYLLRVLPAVCDGPPPDVLLVGIEGPAGDDTIAAAADACVEAAADGRRPSTRAHTDMPGGQL